MSPVEFTDSVCVMRVAKCIYRYMPTFVKHAIALLPIKKGYLLLTGYNV